MKSIFDNLFDETFDKQKRLCSLMEQGISYDAALRAVYGDDIVDRTKRITNTVQSNDHLDLSATFNSLFTPPPAEEELPAMKLVDAATKLEFEPDQAKKS